MNERERARIASLRDFMSRIGHEFADPALLDEALISKLDIAGLIYTLDILKLVALDIKPHVRL